MELHNGHSHQPEDGGRISMLPDDILLSISGRVNVATAVRASVLSTRWRHLPWLLPQLSVDVNDYLRGPCSDPEVAEHLDKAMASLIKATRSFLAALRGECVITRLRLWFFLISSCSSDIGQLVGEAIDNGVVKELELASGVEWNLGHVSDKEMVQHAQSVNGFFAAYPSVSCCLTKLSLYTAAFAESDLHHLLVDIYKQLRHLL